MDFFLHNTAIDQIHALTHFWQILTSISLGLCQAYVWILLFLAFCQDFPQASTSAMEQSPQPLQMSSHLPTVNEELNTNEEPDEPDISWHYDSYELNTQSIF